MWEDAANKVGGKWLAVISVKPFNNINVMWENAVLAIIGETLSDDPSAVCGAVFSRRKKADKIALWVRDAANVEQVLDIGRVRKKN